MEPSTNTISIILRTVLVMEARLLMVIPDRQETIFLVAEQTTIHSCSKG